MGMMMCTATAPTRRRPPPSVDGAGLGGAALAIDRERAPSFVFVPGRGGRGRGAARRAFGGGPPAVCVGRIGSQVGPLRVRGVDEVAGGRRAWAAVFTVVGYPFALDVEKLR